MRHLSHATGGVFARFGQQTCQKTSNLRKINEKKIEKVARFAISPYLCTRFCVRNPLRNLVFGQCHTSRKQLKVKLNQLLMPFKPNGGYRPKPTPGPRPQQRDQRVTNNNGKDQHRINEQIRGVKEVRLVGDNVEMGIYSIQDAMRIAEEQELDLVEISPTAAPPVCKVMDYQKFCYQQKKKAKDAKANAAKVVVKEIRFGPQTDDHDYEFKLRHAKEFLQEGSKVKSYVFFKGRSILFKEQGEVLLARFAQDLEEFGKPDSYPPVLEGKRMILMFSPKAAKKAAPKPDAPKEDKE